MQDASGGQNATKSASAGGQDVAGPPVYSLSCRMLLETKMLQKPTDHPLTCIMLLETNRLQKPLTCRMLLEARILKEPPGNIFLQPVYCWKSRCCRSLLTILLHTYMWMLLEALTVSSYMQDAAEKKDAAEAYHPSSYL
jgi:hypothetical protein